MATFTVLGGSGFIGGHLVRHLERSGHRVATPPRGAMPGTDPGHVIYCVGVTADFRTRPFETVAAHVTHLAEVLARARATSFLYLSSTRVYRTGGGEDEPLTLRPADPDDLYNATKIAGEALCLAQPAATVRVARLSNVYGPGMGSDSFLAAVLCESLTGRLRLATSLDSEKDYVAVEDVVRALERIALRGRHRLYNVAAGVNVSHRGVVERLVGLTGCKISVAHAAPRIAFPVIDTRRIAAEFDTVEPWSPAGLLDRMPGLVADARAARLPQELAS
jgi:nucleoside-diphosphate-sugar epimerase